MLRHWPCTMAVCVALSILVCLTMMAADQMLPCRSSNCRSWYHFLTQQWAVIKPYKASQSDDVYWCLIPCTVAESCRCCTHSTQSHSIQLSVCHMSWDNICWECLKETQQPGCMNICNKGLVSSCRTPAWPLSQPKVRNPKDLISLWCHLREIHQRYTGWNTWRKLCAYVDFETSCELLHTSC